MKSNVGVLGDKAHVMAKEPAASDLQAAPEQGIDQAPHSVYEVLTRQIIDIDDEAMMCPVKPNANSNLWGLPAPKSCSRPTLPR